MQVFISHTRADHGLAEALTKEMRNAGLQVWRPDESIFPGDNWALEIGKALETSDVMVALFTREAADSTTLKQDVQYALTSGNYRGRVIPVLVDFVTFHAGRDVPWVLLRLEPVYVQWTPTPGRPYDFSPVVKRVQKLAESGCNATA